MCLPHHQLVLKWNGIAHDPTNGIRTKVVGSSHKSVIVLERLLGKSQFDSLHYSKTGPCGVMSKVIKDLSMSSLSPFGFKVE